MDESVRRFKFGQFGHGKYASPTEPWRRVEAFFRDALPRRFPAGNLLSVV